MPNYSPSIPDEPDWFALNHYDVLTTFSVVEWASLLDELHFLSAQRPSKTLVADWIRQRPHGSAADRTPLTFTQAILTDLLHAGTVPVPPLRELTLEAVGQDFEVSIGESHLLAVDLSASNTVLEAMFARWLEEKRRTDYRYSGTRPKGPSPKEWLGDTQFSSWISYKIVPLLDLEFWLRHSLPGRSVSDAIIGDWLFPDYSNPAQQVSYARKKYREAFANLEFIKAQALL